MKHSIRPLLRVAALVPLFVWGGGGCGGCGALKRFLYEPPGRDGWQRPAEVVAALGLERGDHVADLGAGGGYFTFLFAEEVGPEGRVYAIDIDDSLLAHVASQAKKRGLPQIETVRASEDSPGLPDGSVDLIFLSNVFHHLPEPSRYFANARGLLRPGGRLAVVEVARDSFPRGHATSPEEIVAQMGEAGFDLVERLELLESQSFQIFAPRLEPSP